MFARRFQESTIRPRLGRQPSRISLILGVLIVASVCAWLIWLATAEESLPDFREYPAGAERKAAFFTFLRPIIRDANADILATRLRLSDIDGDAPGWRDERVVNRLAEKYGLESSDAAFEDKLAALLLRVDTIPEALALAQAAKESGWGTSRFARVGNNLFGEWCFEEGCGVVPLNRAAGRTHEVRRFTSPRASIDSYLLNLNSHPAYRELRQLRHQSRQAGRPLSGSRLANGLARYSERGEIYVTEIQSLIRGNDLE